MNAYRLVAVVLGGLLVLGGCRGGGQIPISAGESSDLASGGGSSTTTTGLPSDGNIALTPEEIRRQELMRNNIVYFDFDRSEIRPEFNAMLTDHAGFLANNPSVRLRLEGHADETGSREYNIGLGERRAQAVRQILLLQGASTTQLETVSYGEERPAVIGSDEEAYRLNRRVELIYPNANAR